MFERCQRSSKWNMIRRIRILMLTLLGVLCFSAVAVADNQYSGSGCMVLLNFFDAESGNALFSTTYSGQPSNKVNGYTFENVMNGANQYSFRAVTLPTNWTSGSLKLSLTAPDNYNILSQNREIKRSTLLQHWASVESELASYVDISVPVIAKGHTFNISESVGMWSKSFMSAELKVTGGKVTAYIFHNRFPLELGSDYTLSFGSVQSNGQKNVIMTGKGRYTGQRVIGTVASSVTMTGGAGPIATKPDSGSKPSVTYRVGDTFTKDYFTYKVLTVKGKKGTVRLTKVKKITSNISFKNTIKINGYTFTLTEIGDNVFSGSAVVKTVTLSKSLTKIGNSAFANCKNLKSVKMDKTLTTIGKKAFANCTSLKSIVIPSKVKTIKAQAFSGCKRLTNMKIQSSVLKTVGKGFVRGTSKKLTISTTSKNRKKITSLIRKGK